MKIEDAIVYMQSRRPIVPNKHVTLDAFLLATAVSGQQPDKGIAQKLLDAEEIFLPHDERTFAQLQNPRFQRVLDNLPEGLTAVVTDDVVDWITDSRTPQAMDTVYSRSTLL